MKLKPIQFLQILGNLLFSAGAVVWAVGLYNADGFGFPLGFTLLLCALITSTQMLLFFRRVGTVRAWFAMSILLLLSILLCKDAGTGLLIGGCALAVPLAVSFYWPSLRRIAPMAKWALPTAGVLMFGATLGYSALHFETFGFAPIQGRIAEKWILYVREVQPIFQKVYPADMYEKMKPILEVMVQREQALAIAFTFLMLAVFALFGIFFIAVFWADHRLKKAGEKRWCGSWSRLIPPRGISWAYMLVNILSGFAAQEMMMPLNATLTLFGFFYIFTAVYKLERFMARKNVPGIFRALVVVALFAASFFTAGTNVYPVYTVLLFVGWWIATAPARVRVIKK